jgi:hypothetical protein
MFSTWSSSHADKFGEGGAPSDLVEMQLLIMQWALRYEEQLLC